MPLWIVCLVAIVCAIIAFMYLPTPLSWIIGGTILLITVVVAFRDSRPGGRV